MVGRPRGNTKPFIFRMSEDLHDQLKAQAAIEGMTISEFLQSVILDFMEKQPDHVKKTIKGIKRRAVKK